MSQDDSTDRDEVARAKRLKWYYRNRERANIANKEWRAKNKEHRRQTAKERYARNKDEPGFKEKRNEQARLRKKQNPQKIAAQRKAYRHRQQEHLKQVSRRNHLRRKFGITLAEYQALLEEQGGRCAICRTDDPAPHKYLTVDHDHAKGAIRQLLCFHCNAGLGHFRDQPALLQAAIDYLRRHHENAS